MEPIPKCIILQRLRLIRQRRVDSDVLEEPGHSPGRTVFGGLLRRHQRDPVVDQDVDRMLAVEQ